jgi:hypothetical protein
VCVLDDVATEIVIDDGGSSGRGRLTVLRLGWCRQDPLAVTLLLTAQPDHPALPRGSWVVLRDFLRYGLEEPTGDGEVRIRPEPATGRIQLELNRPGRPCCVSVPEQRLREFLAATDDCVPFGEERSDDALDALIERLLAT